MAHIRATVHNGADLKLHLEDMSKQLADVAVGRVLALACIHVSSHEQRRFSKTVDVIRVYEVPPLVDLRQATGTYRIDALESHGMVPGYAGGPQL